MHACRKLTFHGVPNTIRSLLTKDLFDFGVQFTVIAECE
jgi:hypothetical protein